MPLDPHQEELLDEALEETFPASDPVAPALTAKEKPSDPEAALE